jgi:hypothetical protein
VFEKAAVRFVHVDGSKSTRATSNPFYSGGGSDIGPRADNGISRVLSIS